MIPGRKKKIFYTKHLCEEDSRGPECEMRCREYFVNDIFHKTHQQLVNLARNWGVKIDGRRKFSREEKVELANRLFDHPFNDLRNPNRPKMKRLFPKKKRVRDKAKNLEAQRKHRSNETAGQRKERLEKSKLRMRKLRSRTHKTVAEIKREKKKRSQQKAKQRQKETAERRNERLKKRRERWKEKRSKETFEEREERLERECELRFFRKPLCPICDRICKTNYQRGACIRKHAKEGINTKKQYQELAEIYLEQERQSNLRKVLRHFKKSNSTEWIQNYLQKRLYHDSGRYRRKAERDEYLKSFLRQRRHERTKNITLQIDEETIRYLNESVSENS